MRGVAVALAVVALAWPSTVPAAADLALHLAKDPAAGRLLVAVAPGGSNPTEDALTAKEGESVVFGPFATEPAAVASRLGRGPVAFALYLATGASGMPDCAAVAVTLHKRADGGGLTMLASAQFGTSLAPSVDLAGPIAGLVPLDGSAAARTVASGDTLELTVAVTNLCGDGAHSVRLHYGATTRPSRIAFTDNCIAVDNPDQTDTDDDGPGDACDVCPSIADESQADADGDRVGDLCDDCPAVADPAQADTDGDGTGSACDACPDAAGPAGGAGGCPCTAADCDDEDPCTTDACDDASGCRHEASVGLAFVECRLLFLRDLVVHSEEIAPELRRPTSPLRRALKQAGRALLRAERAVRRGARSYPRRAADLGRRVHVVVARLFEAERAGLVPQAVHDRLALLAGEALASIPAP